MTQVSISLVTLSLFVCSVHLYPSIQPSLSSHSLIGDSMRECLDSLQHMSLVLTALWLHCLLTKVTEHKAEMCLWHDCVFVLTKLQKPRHMRIVHFSTLCRSYYSHTKFTLFSWEAARGCTTLCLYRLCPWIQANYRNRLERFKYLFQTTDHFIRLLFKHRGEINTKPKSRSKCNMQSIVLHEQQLIIKLDESHVFVINCLIHKRFKNQHTAATVCSACATALL